MSQTQEFQATTTEVAKAILNEDEMTLDEKLAAIDRMIKKTAAEFSRVNPSLAPIDPAAAFICDGCE